MTTYPIFVPGRLCLFGEHSDWAGERRRALPALAPGACLIAGTSQGIHARIDPHSDFEVSSRLPDGEVRGPFVVAMEEGALAQAAGERGFFSYAAGAAMAVSRRYRCGGVRIRVDAMDLPIGRGLSSSAAICVLTVRAFSLAYDLGLSVIQEMDLAYEGERAAASQCGRMDQACAYGRRPVLLRFDGEDLDVEPLSVPVPLHLLIVDLQARKDTRRILADLQREFDVPDRKLRSALGALNLAIVARARAALLAGDAEELGGCMVEAQKLFDERIAPCSYAELRAPRLHAVLRFGPAAELTWGGKGVGSQGDGCAQFVCRGAAEQTELARQLTAAAMGRCLPLSLGT